MAGHAYHVPVLLREVLALLQPAPGFVCIDGTVGGGGHAAAILAASAPDGFLLGIDRDPQALAAAEQRLAPYAGRFCLARGNYADMAAIAAERGIDQADGILLDIGVSSHQLDAASRGFSYQQDALLDMRMDQSSGRTAAELINSESEAELTRILYTYGEEKWAKRIAAFIAEARALKPIETTSELVDIIKKAIPAGAREKDQHPAKRSFQALRIAVNDELGALTQGLERAISLLKSGGVLAVISFHSLEDRIVKDCLRTHATDCICPPRTPVCLCQHRADVRLLTRKPLTAAAAEAEANPRSRSTRLRAAVKL
ncbi:MAG: 16S rRNA (cytosine(1402)-N(4))-methyltransferase RsmH [Clostridia bacterium]|nr:16S rRNA (cytosine(1402)-N(4))-methyltransferase RsmH [Clostridia bacterium]